MVSNFQSGGMTSEKLNRQMSRASETIERPVKQRRRAYGGAAAEGRGGGEKKEKSGERERDG